MTSVRDCAELRRMVYYTYLWDWYNSNNNKFWKYQQSAATAATAKRKKTESQPISVETQRKIAQYEQK